MLKMMLITWLISRKVPRTSAPSAFWGEYGDYPRLYFDTPECANSYVKECMAKTKDKLSRKEPVVDTKNNRWKITLPDGDIRLYEKEKDAQKALEDALTKKYFQNHKNRNLNQKWSYQTASQYSYPTKYDWGKNLNVLNEKRFCNLEKGDKCYVALVTDTGFEHCAPWEEWIVKNSNYDNPNFTFAIPPNTTIVGLFIYKDSEIVMSNRMPAQRFYSQGTYTITLTYERKGK